MGRESGAVRFEAVLALLPARTHQPRAAPPPPRRAGDEDDQDDDSDGDGGGGKEDGQSSPLEGEESERRRGRIFLIWADGNLRLLHIGPCAVITEVLCNSRHPNLILPPSTPARAVSASFAFDLSSPATYMSFSSSNAYLLFVRVPCRWIMFRCHPFIGRTRPLPSTLPRFHLLDRFTTLC